MGKKVRQAWEALKEDFVRRRLGGERISLADFAREKGVDRRSVERHASAEGWLQAVDQRAMEQQQAVDAHSQRVVQRLRYAVNFDELTMRQEHARAMHELCDVALRKLAKLDADSLTVDEMIAIFKFAPREERAAMGIPDSANRTNRTAIAMVDTPAQREFEDRLRQKRKTALAFAELQRIVEGESTAAQTPEPSGTSGARGEGN